MDNYRLYHGAWVYCGEASKEYALTASQAMELLRGGGYFSEKCL